MKIVELNANSPSVFRQDMLQLNIEFQKALGTEFPSESKIKQGLNRILSDDSPGQAVLLLDDLQESVGMMYFNRGSGMACGGDYVWLNGIYIKEGYRKKGYAAMLIDHLIKWADENHVVHILTMRHPENKASGALFDKFAFNQEANISMGIDL